MLNKLPEVPFLSDTLDDLPLDELEHMLHLYEGSQIGVNESQNFENGHFIGKNDLIACTKTIGLALE